MSNQVDFEFQVNQTTIHVLYEDPTHIVADGVISSDDVYFSASSGVSKMIWIAAGANHLRRDIQKFTPPVPLGSVMLTSAGRLRSKYIFHVAALDFNIRSDPKYIFPQIVHRVLDIANVLQLESLATPSLVVNPTSLNNKTNIISQLSGYPEIKLIEFLLRTLSSYLAFKQCSVKKITLVIYDDESQDHQASEQKFVETLSDLLSQVEQWKQKSKAPNARLAHLVPLSELITEDGDFKASVQKTILDNREELHKIFLDPSIDLSEYQNMGDKLNKQELIQRKERLENALKHFDEQFKFQEDLQEAHKRRLDELQIEYAKLGIYAPPHIPNEIEDIKKDIEDCKLQIQHINGQKDAAQRDLENIKHLLDLVSD